MRSEVIYVCISDTDGLVFQIEHFRGSLYYNHAKCFGSKSKKHVIKPNKEQWKSFWETCKIIDIENWKDKYYGQPFGKSPYLEVEIQSRNIFASYSGDYICTNDYGEADLGDLIGEVVDLKKTTKIEQFVIAVRELIGDLPFG